MSKPDACSSSVRERRGGHGRRRRYHARSTRRAGAFRFLPPPPPSFGTKVVWVDRSRPVGLGGAWKQTGACCCRGGCEKAVPFGLGGRRTDLPGGGAQCVGGRVRQWRPCGGGRTAQDTGGATRVRIVVACVGVWAVSFGSPLFRLQLKNATSEPRPAAGPARPASPALPQFARTGTPIRRSDELRVPTTLTGGLN